MHSEASIVDVENNKRRFHGIGVFETARMSSMSSVDNEVPEESIISSL